ncbi:hypothetical protein UlMin_018952 [Ulmus minor]
MRRNCNLELRLLPSSGYFPSSSSSDHNQTETEESNESPKQNQPITIFYNGRICVCDVTDFQAKAILILASKELDQEKGLKTPTTPATPATPAAVPWSPSVKSPLPVYSPAAGLSMKKSLQRFLQKRKIRAQATSPYHH